MTPNNEHKEFLLHEEKERLTTFPIRHKDIWDAYQKQLKSFWTEKEVDLSRDYKDWVKLSKDEQHFIKTVLAFFAASDGIVNMNLVERFSQEIKPLEAKYGYGIQIAIENIHATMYSLMIDTYIKDIKEKDFLLNAVETVPCVKRKADWALKWIKSDESFAKRLVAFAIVEGIFFSGSFCAIYWLKERNLMPGLCLANEFIARDEAEHCRFACLLYSHLQYTKLSYDTIREIVTEAVDIETEFITESLPCSLIGMNAVKMTQYIKFVADSLVRQLGYKNIYNETLPFEFMEHISLLGKNNFFENRTSQYKKADLTNSTSFKRTYDF